MVIILKTENILDETKIIKSFNLCFIFSLFADSWMVHIWEKSYATQLQYLFFKLKQTAFPGTLNYKVLAPKPLMCYHRHLKYSYCYDILASGKCRQS